MRAVLDLGSTAFILALSLFPPFFSLCFFIFFVFLFLSFFPLLFSSFLSLFLLLSLSLGRLRAIFFGGGFRRGRCWKMTKKGAGQGSGFGG